jgi:hypothetical protein
MCVCVFVSFAYLVDKGEIDTLYPYKLPPMHALVNMPPKKLQLPIISIMLFIIIIIISIVKKPPHAKSHFNTLAILQSCQTKNSVPKIPKSPNPQIPQVREKKEDLSLLGGFHSEEANGFINNGAAAVSCYLCSSVAAAQTMLCHSESSSNNTKQQQQHSSNSTITPFKFQGNKHKWLTSSLSLDSLDGTVAFLGFMLV